MAIPLSIFYYLYLLAVVVFLFFSLISVYRFVNLSGFDSISLIISLIYITMSGLMLLLAWGYISQINWQEAISLMPLLGTPTGLDL